MKSEQIPETGKNTLNILYVVFIFFGIAFTIIDPLIPLVSEKLGIGYDRIGLILFTSSSISLAATFLSGRFSDRYDLKKIIMSGIIISSAGFLIYGIVFGFIVFLLTVVFFRIGCGILDSSIHAYISKSYKNQQSALFVKLDMFWYIGAVISPMVVSILLYLDIDTRYAFMGFFAAILLVFLLFIKSFNGLKHNSQNDFRDPVEKNIKTAVEMPEDSKTIAGEPLNCFAGHGNTYLKILKNPVILLCAAGLFFYIGIFTLLSTWLTTYFADFGISVAFSSAVLSGFWAFNAVGLFITGRFIRRFNENKLILLYSIIGAICTVFYSMLQNIYVKIIFLILQAIFYSSFFPILNSIAVRENEKSCGTVLGITLSVSVIGLVFFQPVSGSVMEYSGKDGVNYLLIATSALFLVSILTLYLKIVRQNRN